MVEKEQTEYIYAQLKSLLKIKDGMKSILLFLIIFNLAHILRVIKPSHSVVVPDQMKLGKIVGFTLN